MSSATTDEDVQALAGRLLALCHKIPTEVLFPKFGPEGFALLISFPSYKRATRLAERLERHLQKKAWLAPDQVDELLGQAVVLTREMAALRKALDPGEGGMAFCRLVACARWFGWSVACSRAKLLQNRRHC